MGLFGIKKKYAEKTTDMHQTTEKENVGKSEGSLSDLETRKKIADRLIKITESIEDLSNQIYHLQQRVEFLEKKIRSKEG
ncbi:MAG: hypothetical protein QXU40_01275 [Candidatus Pacearchaeota archaeon]